MTTRGTPPRRPGKVARERLLAVAALVVLAPVFGLVTLAMIIEGLLDRDARGPILFAEDRIAQGRVIRLLKFRTLRRSALEGLGPGPTHIAKLERDVSNRTRVGHVLKQWYLDEMPQIINVVRGDMLIVGTRPYPIELYEAELARGVTRKRDMPAGLVGPVQSHKGDPADPDGVALDAAYQRLLEEASGWRLLREDLAILARSIGVQMRHEGI